MAERYTILNQRPVREATPGGTFEDAMEIAFTTTPSKVEGRVVVPLSRYTPEHVNEVLDAQAALIEAVQAL